MAGEKTQVDSYPCDCRDGAVKEYWGEFHIYQPPSDPPYDRGTGAPLLFRCAECKSVLMVVSEGPTSPESKTWYRLDHTEFG